MTAVFWLDQWLWSEIGLVLEATGFIILFSDLLRSFASERELSEQLADTKLLSSYVSIAPLGIPPSPTLHRDVADIQEADRARRAEAWTVARARLVNAAPALIFGGLGFFASAIGNWHFG